MRIKSESNIKINSLKELLKAFYFNQINITIFDELLKKKYDKEINARITFSEEDNVEFIGTFFPLEFAVCANKILLVKILLDAGAKPNMGFYRPINLLVQMCSIHGKLHSFSIILDMLLEKGADLNGYCETSGGTPLHLAVQGELTDIIKILLEKGANINAPDTEGETPLIKAIQSNQLDLIHLLCDWGAEVKPFKVNINNKWKITSPLALALDLNDEPLGIYLINYMMQKPFSSMEKILQKIFVEYAIPFGSVEFLSTLLNTKLININCVIPRERNTMKHPPISPLYYACLRDSYEMAKLLLEFDADVNYYKVEDVPALTAAVLKKQVNIIRLFMDSGKLNQFSIEHAFNVAIKFHLYDIMMILRNAYYPELNMELNFESLENNTPIIIKCILIYDYEKNFKKLLKEKSYSLETLSQFMLIAIEYDALKSFQYLITQYNCNPLERIENRTALLHAIMRKNLRFCHYIIEEMIKRNQMDLVKDHLNVYRFVLEKKADPIQTQEFIDIIQALEQTFFSNNSSILPFSSASEVQQSIVTGRKFLLEQGILPETIKKMRESKCQNTFFTPAPTDLELKIPTWFSDEIIFDMEQFRAIEDKHSSRNAFLWIAPEIRTEDNCSETIFANFNAIERLTFSNKCIKAIKIDYTMNCLINDLGVSIKASHELKVPTGQERILLFPIVSHCKSAILYLGCKFLPNGLHETKDLRQLKSGEKKKVVSLTLPITEAQPTPKI